jgi:outer membrane protein assembly factor BamB
LLAPIWQDGAIWLASLDADSGTTNWQTQLCLEPDGGRSVWSAVGIAVEGGTAYVATGAGAVAAVDARWGNLQWIATYPRGKNQNGQTLLDGCEEDVVIPQGPMVIALASDCSEIFALDRRTGALRWTTPRKLSSNVPAVDYCLGVLGDYLYLAGSEVLRCQNVIGGRAVWEHRLTVSLGRGALTSDAIYVPEGNTVVRIDPSPNHMLDGKRRSLLGIAPGYPEPMGNIVSDGKHLLGLGMSRVYKLGVRPETAALRFNKTGT